MYTHINVYCVYIIYYDLHVYTCMCVCLCIMCLQAIPKLKSLDLSWNCLTDYCEDLDIVCKHCPVLEVLDTRHNPWKYVSE